MTTDQKEKGQVREIALEVLVEVLEKGGYSHKVLGAALSKYQYMDKQQRGFLTRLCEGTIERALELDYIIDHFSKVPIKKQKPVIRNILRMSVYQLKYMDSVPASAACNEAVKLATKKGFYNLKGFVNGVLRNISRGLHEFIYPDKDIELAMYLSVRYSMPLWMVEFWLSSYSKEIVESMLEAFCSTKDTSIRVNLNKITKDSLKNILEQQGINVNKGAYLPCALRISNYNYLSSLEEFKKGYFQVQDESSMLVGEVTGVQPGDLVVDVCAAPGGKSLHVAELLNGTGKVISRDLTPDKTALIEENNTRLGFSNMQIEVYDALSFDPTLEGKADVVIADLPCSGLGVIGKKPDIKYRVTIKDLTSLQQLQQDILKVVTRYVKPGGILIYSTCTISPLENEENLSWLESQGEFSLESIDPYIPEQLQDATTKKGYLQMIPGVHETDGFFVARLKKNF